MHYYEMIDDNIIKVYYNASADLTIENYADYYRIATIDPQSLLFDGSFSDYDIQGNRIFTGNFVNGKLNGICTYYYSDAAIKETGKYESGVRDSVWSFYFSNGQIDKIINYENGIPYVSESYSKKGKQLISNGTGKYSGAFYKNNGKKQKYYISGNLVNGKLDGKWMVNNVTTEYFDNGVFINGYDVLTYTSPQQIQLENILGYYCQENITLFQNRYFCKSCKEDISWALYNVSAKINDYPYDTFLADVSKILDSLNITTLVQIIEFQVNKDGTISNIKTNASSGGLKDDILFNILNNIQWFPLQCDGNSEGVIFMTVVKLDSTLYLPKPIVITGNLEANFMIKNMTDNELLICK